HRKFLARARDDLRVHLYGRDAFIEAGLGEHGAPRVDHPGVTAQPDARLFAYRVARDQQDLLLDRARLREQAPVAEPRRWPRRGGHHELRANTDKPAPDLREPKVEAGRSAQCPERGRYRRDPVAWGQQFSLKGLIAEDVDLAVPVQHRTVRACEHGRVEQASLLIPLDVTAGQHIAPQLGRPPYGVCHRRPVRGFGGRLVPVEGEVPGGPQFWQHDQVAAGRALHELRDAAAPLLDRLLGGRCDLDQSDAHPFSLVMALYQLNILIYQATISKI